jgi:uncharacterized RDD family membrane protein YckC
MSTDQPPPDEPPRQPPNQPPPDQPPPGNPYSGGPYGAPPPGGGDPYGGGGQPGGGGPYGQGPYGGNPYEGGPYGGGGPDPLAGMPPLAPGGKRLLARIIDIIIVLIPSFLLDWAAVGLHDDDFTAGRSAVGGVFTFGIGFLYEFFSSRATGQTLGKKAMGLRAARLSDGSVPDAQSAAVRALVLWLPAFCCSCLWFVIIGLTVLFDKPYKQGLEDKAAKTVVVEAT